MARTIRDQDANHVLALKGNQPQLHEAVVETFAVEQAEDLEGCHHDFHKTVNQNHGRIEGARPGVWAGFGVGMARAARRDPGILQVRWVAADGGYSTQTFVEGVQALGLHIVGRLRKDTVLRFRYTGPHARRPGRKR